MASKPLQFTSRIFRLGYFNKICSAEIFVFLDDVEFSKGSYINRSRIRVGDDAKWLTMPVKYRSTAEIRHTKIGDTQWRESHIQKLSEVYRRPITSRTFYPSSRISIAKLITQPLPPLISWRSRNSPGCLIAARVRFIVRLSDLREERRTTSRVGATTRRYAVPVGRWRQRLLDEEIFRAAGVELALLGLLPATLCANWLRLCAHFSARRDV